MSITEDEVMVSQGNKNEYYYTVEGKKGTVLSTESIGLKFDFDLF